jgi:Immunity protein 27
MDTKPRELRGTEAVEFAQRLRKVASNPDTWEIEYIDEQTGEQWLMDYPDSGSHGGGSPRLRKI